MKRTMPGEAEAAALMLGPLYGLRTWTLLGDRGAERSSGPYSRTPWPEGRAWLQATCRRDGSRAPPVATCTCGVSGWHPSRPNARRILAIRREIAGIVEARGAVEVHADGFRAQSGRPHALVIHRRSNPHLVRRLGAVYGAAIVEPAMPTRSSRGAGSATSGSARRASRRCSGSH